MAWAMRRAPMGAAAIALAAIAEREIGNHLAAGHDACRCTSAYSSRRCRRRWPRNGVIKYDTTRG